MNINLKYVVSIVIIVFLALIIVNHFFKDIFKLNPFYRNKILLEGFDSSGNEVEMSSVKASSGSESEPSVKASSSSDSGPTDSVSGPTDSVSGPTGSASTGSVSTGSVSTGSVSTSPTLIASGSALKTSGPSGLDGTPIQTSTISESEMSETDKSTMMAELFEKVNNQMDIIRTLRLSDNFKPINIDKTVSDPFTILMNLKLLINNGIYKNEIDLKEMYDKYIGNKSVQLLTSEINSINMDSGSNPNIGSLETTILVKTKSIVDGHQKIIDKLLEIKSNE